MHSKKLAGAYLVAGFSSLWLLPSASAQLALNSSNGTIYFGTVGIGSYATGAFSSDTYRSEPTLDPGFSYSHSPSGAFGGGFGSIYAIPYGTTTGIVRTFYGVKDTVTASDAASVLSIHGSTIYDSQATQIVTAEMNMPFFFHLDAPAYEGDLPYVAANLSVSINGVNASMDFYFNGTGGSTDRMDLYIGPHGESSESFSETFFITATQNLDGSFDGFFPYGYIFDTSQVDENDLVGNSSILNLTAYSGWIGTSEYTAVPEPATWQAIAGLGLVAFAGQRRWRKAA